MTGTRSTFDAAVAAGDAPGLQYAAVSADGPVFEYAGGFAELTPKRPMDDATTLMAYSMSKTITAAAVLALVEDGRLGLDDAIDGYVDGSPYGGEITIRQLLAHTAGIPNPIPLRWVHPPLRDVPFDEASALAAVLREHPTRSSSPGVRYAYANIGYWLLGSIVSAASGRAFTAYVGERVLSPLGIPPEELGYAIAAPERHAAGYLERWSLFNVVKGLLVDRAFIGPRSGSWIEIKPHLANGPAFGGLVGAARGFGKFLQDQLRPRSAILGDACRALFYEPQRVRGGRTIPMTLGWHVGSRGGVRFFYKEGGGGGFHSMMRLYPERGIGAVIFANATGFRAARFLDAVDAQLVV